MYLEGQLVDLTIVLKVLIQKGLKRSIVPQAIGYGCSQLIGYSAAVQLRHLQRQIGRREKLKHAVQF